MTDIQTMASDPAHSVWLAAHAGTGKTKVLVDRVLRLLLAGAELSSVLCITYTKAAAMEMQLRIRKVLSGWVMAPEETLKSELSVLLDRPATNDEIRLARVLLCRVIDHPQGLQIQTIHAFCQGLLSKFPVEAGLSPHFTVMEEEAANQLLQEATSRLLLLRVNDPKDEAIMVQSLAHVASCVADSTLAEMLKAVVDDHALFFSLLAPPQGRKKLIGRVYQNLQTNPEETGETLQASLMQKLQSLKPDLHATLLSLMSGSKDQQKLGLQLENWLLHSNDPSATTALADACLTGDGEPRKKIFTLAKNDAHSQILGQLRDLAVAHEQSRRALAVANYSEALILLADGLLGIYRTLKQQRALLDFDDVIMGVIALLSQDGISGWVMSRLGYRIQHLLIDEAQDTAPAQWMLTDRLLSELFQPDMAGSQPRTLFVVGDAKQSIYRFQGADPALFSHKRNDYRHWFAATGSPFVELTLDRSFRSSPAILQVVDRVCSMPQLQAALGVFSDDHAVHRHEDASIVELWPLISLPKPETPMAWDVTIPLYAQHDAAHLMACELAATIKEWLDGKRILPSKGRPVEAGDIMILVRRRGTLVKALSRQLQQAGVPVAGADRIVLADHLAVKDVLVIAQWCLLPEDDLALATLLKGPLFALDEDALFALAHNRKETSLWQKMQQDGHPEQVQALQSLFEKARHETPYRFMTYLLQTLGLQMQMKARMGSEVDDVCHELLAQTLKMQQAGSCSLQECVATLQQAASQIKRDLEQGVNAVRILTVHGAKGLQSPIVFLPDTTRKPDNKDKLWWEENNQHHTCYAVPSGVKPPERVAQLKQAIRQTEYEEYLRLLYVALTRAEDELYICGATHNATAQEGSWYELMSHVLADCEGMKKEPARDGEKMVVASPQIRVVPQALPSQAASSEPLPSWVQASLPAEEKANFMRPSEMLHHAESGALAARGTLIHRLLQWMPQPDHADALNDLTARAAGWAEQEPQGGIAAVVEEVWRVRSDPNLAWIFGTGSKAEVALRAQHPSGRIISGQMDRLIVMPDGVHIVDFKSGRDVPAHAAEAPQSYRRQLADYVWLVRRLYAGRPIRAYLLWTATASLMEVNSELLENDGLQLDSNASAA